MEPSKTSQESNLFLSNNATRVYIKSLRKMSTKVILAGQGHRFTGICTPPSKSPKSPSKMTHLRWEQSAENCVNHFHHFLLTLVLQIANH